MEKIAILGGGVGAMTTAVELTNDPNWKSKYDITIYQLGWRLGGKGATGRGVNDRIQEHGLHVWMGFYENAFHLIRSAYDECHKNNLMPDSPFTDARKAFSPMSFAPLAENWNGKWEIWPTRWPTTDEFPGGKELFDQKLDAPTPWVFVTKLLNNVHDEVETKKVSHPVLVGLYNVVVGDIVDKIGGDPSNKAVPSKSAPDGTLLHAVRSFIDTLEADLGFHKKSDHDFILELLEKFLKDLFTLIGDLVDGDAELRHFAIMVDTSLTVVAGIIRDDVLSKGFQSIDNYDLTEWLARNGARYPDSALTIGMYDAIFAYQYGMPERRRVAAGSALYGALRLMLTYKGSLMWWMNAGMGETIFTPIYLLLKMRGVKFKFFQKVTNLGVSADKKSIDTIEIDIQATPKPDLPDGYAPLMTVPCGIPCWPTVPFYDQLVEGQAMQNPALKNPDIESWWSDWKPVGHTTLKRGTDFDRVVLGISIGAFRYICGELIQNDATLGWKNMVANVETVKTIGLQLWLNKSAADLGWKGGPPVFCGYVEPFDTWSDLSHVIQYENWQPSQNVVQAAYFCNSFPDEKPGALPPPFDYYTYPQEQWQRGDAMATMFLNQDVGLLWPKAQDSQRGFDSSLVASRFVRVNVEPTELYVLTMPGATQYRLASGDSRFSNLYLAGDWTLTDLNLGCVEAAVISGRMASQAISGQPSFIYGAFGDKVKLGG